MKNAIAIKIGAIFRCFCIVVLLISACAAISYSEDVGSGDGYKIWIDSTVAPDADSKGRNYYISSAMQDVGDNDARFQEFARYVENALLLSNNEYVRLGDPDKADIGIRISYNVGKMEAVKGGSISRKSLTVGAYDLKDPDQPQLWKVNLYSKDGGVDEIHSGRDALLEIAPHMAIAAMPYFWAPFNLPSVTQTEDGKKYIIIFLDDPRLTYITNNREEQGQPSTYVPPAKYAANFNYTPSAKTVPGSAGVTFAIGDLTYNFQRDTAVHWYNSEQFANLPDATKRDLSNLLMAKGFSVSGSFDSYDLIPFQDKKVIDLYLVPTFELFVTVKDKKMEYKAGWVQTGNIQVTGKMLLELREIVTRELMCPRVSPTNLNFPID
ncbi:MAG: hypothetical protein ABID83_03165 [Candidatus Omnitrophota bacterium]